jgi:hypothetical protein
MLRTGPFLAIAIAIAGCSSSSSTPAGAGGGSSSAAGGATARFDLTADTDTQDGFYAMPLPSDLRLDGKGAPSFKGFPDPKAMPTVKALAALVADHKGWPVMPVAYFAFDAPLAEHAQADVIPAAVGSPVLLVDVDPKSPERGKLRPTVAQTLDADGYAPENVLAVAARPGFVLRGGVKYAFVVLKDLKDATGKPLGVPADLATLASGGVPGGAKGAAAKGLYASLWETLDTLKIDRASVAAATVFTTGDAIAETLDLVTKLRAKYPVKIEGLAVDPSDETDALCRVNATVAYPQFQKGEPPFDTDGLFEVGDDGLPKHQRDEKAPVVLVIPKKPMPAAGYPLELFVHGSGGLSDSLLSPLGDDDKPEKGIGPAHALARLGFASASSAMPVNPERQPGASAIAYINANNIPMTRDVFRQGTIEQLLLVDALKTLEIPAEVLASCKGPTLPEGKKAFSYDPDKLVLAGQSMGAWYTNLIGPLEPRIKAVVPTGAGGYLAYFLTTAGPDQSTIHTVAGAIGPILFATYGKFTFVHPAANLAETALEVSDPMLGQPRLGRRPLPGMPARSIFTPVAPGDHYFSPETYEAVQLAYGNEEAGDVAWQGLPDALALDGRGTLIPYPVTSNRTSEDGSKYTGVVVAKKVSGYDPHHLYSHDDGVRHQIACFVASHFATGKATVVAPAALDAPCP